MKKSVSDREREMYCEGEDKKCVARTKEEEPNKIDRELLFFLCPGRVGAGNSILLICP